MDIASFDVDVIDVVAGQPPEDPRILIRVSGPAVEGTGVAEGFSGSPVYCAGEDGVKRNVGAVSETVGQFGETVALVTPIEQMLGVPSDPPVNPRYAPALLRKAKPLRGVLTVSGVSARLGRALQDAARRQQPRVPRGPAGPAGQLIRRRRSSRAPRWPPATRPATSPSAASAPPRTRTATSSTRSATRSTRWAGARCCWRTPTSTR